MKKSVPLFLLTLLVGSSILVYREYYQLNYAETFHLDGESKKTAFVIYPDTTIYNQQVKFHLRGSIQGRATISAWAVHPSKKGPMESAPILDLNLANQPRLDTTLRLPYYGNRKGDKVVLRYKPTSVQQLDLIIQAGIFGLPFEHLLNHFL